MPTRRDFLKTALGASTLAAWTMLPIGRSGWAYAAPFWPFGAPANVNQRRLIVIFLRGAVDGLSVVVPYADEHYYEVRPRIAVPRPGAANGVLDLDGRFGLNPALAPLLPYWHNNGLAFVHASGSSDPSRSHFDAQDFMETGTPGIKGTPTGWLNRLLGVLPMPHAANAALGVGETVPRILSGPQPVANVVLGNGVARKIPSDNALVAAAFDRMYENADAALAAAYHQGRTSRAKIMEDFMAEDAEQKVANGGAPLPNGFARDAAQLAHLIRRDPGIRLAFVGLGGWDTHVNQKGALDGRLKQLGEGLATLARELGPAYQDTAIVVMSEFGRTVAENGDAGTDHGHGNVMWLLGGSVAGGKVYGRWPGLAPEERFQGRDLAVTTDFRYVLAEVLSHHLALSGDQLATVLPGLSGRADGLDGLVASRAATGRA